MYTALNDNVREKKLLFLMIPNAFCTLELTFDVKFTAEKREYTHTLCVWKNNPLKLFWPLTDFKHNPIRADSFYEKPSVLKFPEYKNEFASGLFILPKEQE